jgi:hypothetical protein
MYVAYETDVGLGLSYAVYWEEDVLPSGIESVRPRLGCVSVGFANVYIFFAN